ncbi:MAG: sugar MFS transporter [Chitinophagaceae bacterium]
MTQVKSIPMPAAKSSSNTGAIFIIGVLFFSMGFVTWLNGTLIPFLKLACQLDNDIQAFFVTFASYIAYFFLAIPSSRIIKSAGFKNGLALSLVIMAIGSFVFIPAANIRSFPLFLTGLFIQFAGMALLQTSVNPYISILGPIESAARRISIMGICNKVAGIISPLILSAIVLKNATQIEANINTTSDAVVKAQLLDDLASRVVTPYIIMGIVLIAVAILIKRSTLPEIDTDNESVEASIGKTKTSIFQFPHLLLGVLCIFVYVGAEVMAGDAIGTYGKAMGMTLDKTKYFTTFTLTAMLVGYLIGIVTMPKYISQQKALLISALLGIVFTICVFVTTGYVAITFIALLGLANALMWPSIFPLAIDGLGKFIKIGAALLVMGIVGGALIPLLYASLKDKMHLSNHLSFLICMLPCYVYILYYAAAGYKAGKVGTLNV